jgi:hypothetical protein
MSGRTTPRPREMEERTTALDRFRDAMKAIVAVPKAKASSRKRRSTRSASRPRRSADRRVRRSVPRFVVLVGSDDDLVGWSGPHMPAGSAIEPPDRSHRFAPFEVFTAAASTERLWRRQACGSRS